MKSRLRRPACRPASAATRAAAGAAAVPAGVQSNQAALRRADPTAHVQATLRAPGRPLDAALRGTFERGFGRDFGAVRVHTGAAADRSARALGATAFAAGPHLVFSAGSFSPMTATGFRLLAHELAHVAQSPDLPSTHLPLGARHAPEERQAAAAAARLTAGLPAHIPASEAAPALRRDQPGDKKDAPPDIVPPIVPAPSPSAADPPVPSPKPLLPLPGGFSFDPATTLPGVGGFSMGDIQKGAAWAFGKKPGPALGKMPPCSKLETSTSTPSARVYWTHDDYRRNRDMFHGPTSADPWPETTSAQYDNYIKNCPQGTPTYPPPAAQPAPLTPLPKMPKPPLPDTPPSLPPGQAYA